GRSARTDAEITEESRDVPGPGERAQQLLAAALPYLGQGSRPIPPEPHQLLGPVGVDVEGAITADLARVGTIGADQRLAQGHGLDQWMRERLAERRHEAGIAGLIEVDQLSTIARPRQLQVARLDQLT